MRILALAVAQTLIWAALHYSFAALLPHWQLAFGWSLVELVGAFTLSLLASAAFAPLFGRLIDRKLGANVLTFSALIGGVLMLLLATVTTSWQFYAIWLGLGICMSGALYEPCFAHLTGTLAINARRAITFIMVPRKANGAGFSRCPSLFVSALAVGPTVAAVLRGWGGYALVMASCLLITSIAVVCFAASTRPPTNAHK